MPDAPRKNGLSGPDFPDADRIARFSKNLHGMFGDRRSRLHSCQLGARPLLLLPDRSMLTARAHARPNRGCSVARRVCSEVPRLARQPVSTGTQSMSTETWRQVYHDDAGTKALVTCDDGSCLIEFATTSAEPAMRIEVLTQPRDRRGLPDGPPVEVHTQCVPLVSRSDDLCWLGRCWLPAGLSVRTLRNCFLRLTPMASFNVETDH